MSYLVIVIFVEAAYGVSSTWSSAVNTIFSSKSLLPFSVGFNPDLVESVARGAQLAINQCQNSFKWDPWNCPEAAFVRRQKGQPATKELAYVHAILAAGIVHTVTRNCSRGNIVGCGCDPQYGNFSLPSGRDPKMFEIEAQTREKSTDWRWGGCSDHVKYGEQISRTVLDLTERGNDVTAHIHLHNNFIGRKIVRDSMVKRCRCHGVSGSCTMQTCWMQLAPFAEIAERLRKLYETAEKLDYEGDLGNSATASEKAQSLLNRKSNSLIFTRKSPNYCKSNAATGWQGTLGRFCSRSKLPNVSLVERRSCRNLCLSCGHRIRKLKKEVTKRCNCSFKWCCEVKCDICKEITEEYFCD